MNKSYTPFSLTTLQLPAPSSNLTKAEYKETYGIDLDDVNIPSFKLVVYGKDKFPIDQIKAVEGGYEIYFNGHVLSITDIVQTSNEVYGVENAKPIYCHPIVIIDNDGTMPKRFSGLIFNNSSTPLTLDSFKIWLDNLKEATNGQGKLIITGGVKSSNDICLTAYVYKAANNSYIISGLTTLGAPINITINNFDDLFPVATTELQDGVNKIN